MPGTRRVGLSSRALLLFTGIVLLSGPFWAAFQSTWPVFVGASFFGSTGLLLLWRRDALSMRGVLCGALILRLAYLPVGPGLTDDLFRYIWDGWLQWEGINPYRFVPSDSALAPYQDTALYEALNSSLPPGGSSTTEAGPHRTMF